MELNMTGDGLRAEGEPGQNFVGFEADRIALRRAFEGDHGAMSKEQTATR